MVAIVAEHGSEYLDHEIYHKDDHLHVGDCCEKSSADEKTASIEDAELQKYNNIKMTRQMITVLVTIVNM